MPRRARAAATLRAAPALALALALASTALRSEEERSPTVGMFGRLEGVVLPGPELEAVPLEDDSSPLVVRLTGVYPHGSDHRYDIVFYGLEPGEYNLTEHLRRPDGQPAEGLPPINVTVRPVRPPEELLPNPLSTAPLPEVGGYQAKMIALGALWLLGLVALIALGRKRQDAVAAGGAVAPTLADRLRPVVEKAVAGGISAEEQARLERLLLLFWRQRLGLADLEPAQGIAQLREHDEAGRLLRALEEWIHRPAERRSATTEAEVTALLEPYRHLAADALGEEGAPPQN